MLVFERDLGTSLLFFGIFVALLYVATERRSWLLIGIGLFLSGVASWPGRCSATCSDRVDIWLQPVRPGATSTTSSYQLVQGLFGMGTGGLLGKGLGQGRPDIVPFAKTDFIVAAIGEELGLTGLMALLIVYAIIVQRGLRTAIAVRDSFGKLLAAGLAFSVALQVFVVVGGVTRADPAHRAHHAVPVLRRVVAGRQLGADRPAAAHQRRRAPTRAAARALDPGRQDPGGAVVRSS